MNSATVAKPWALTAPPRRPSVSNVMPDSPRATPARATPAQREARASREARSAKALRANLRRRKEQARARDAASDKSAEPRAAG
jgi:hypothetical protein